jgi:hypothetical protein
MVPLASREAARFAKTRAIVAALADSIAAGAVEPTIAELQALAQLCEDRHLYAEAARVRRWLGDA